MDPRLLPCGLSDPAASAPKRAPSSSRLKHEVVAGLVVDESQPGHHVVVTSQKRAHQGAGDLALFTPACALGLDQCNIDVFGFG